MKRARGCNVHVFLVELYLIKNEDEDDDDDDGGEDEDGGGEMEMKIIWFYQCLVQGWIKLVGAPGALILVGAPNPCVKLTLP